MYEDFFDFRRRPFVAQADPARYYPATVIEQVRQAVARAIDRGEGPAMIMGPAGTGKSLLCQLLAEQFADRFAVAYLASGRITTRQALLQAILYELQLPFRGLDEGELRLSLLDRLKPADDDGERGPDEGLLLVIDEAHTLPWRLLEEVRMLTNVVRDGQPRVRVVLAGASHLEERFAHPNLASFSQRLAARAYLEALDSVETAGYVRALLAAAGGSEKLFTDDALRSVYRATDGIPRLVNQVCDHALILASLGGARQITTEAIEEAWSDLQQLPTPWNTTQKPVAENGVVEFGGLDDGPDDVPTAIPFRSAAPAPLALAEPHEVLDVIEEHLAQMNDFQPAGSIRSEIELDFPEFGDPFAEEFIEEEVVLERFRSDVEMFASLQRVASPQGQQLSAMLELAPGPGLTTRSHSAAELTEVAAIDALGHGEVTFSATVPAATQPICRADVSAALVIERLDAALADELVVVEDEPAGPLWLPPSKRKLEYARLFAKLRRS